MQLYCEHAKIKSLRPMKVFTYCCCGLSLGNEISRDCKVMGGVDLDLVDQLKGY